MPDAKEFLSYSAGAPLRRAPLSPPFGHSSISYGIERIRDVTNLGHRVAYILSCRFRIVIPNSGVYRPGPRSQIEFKDYPALVQSSITVTTNDGATISLLEVFPRTLNTSVSTSASVQEGETSTTTNQFTSGSSTSQANTFGVSVSGGFFGPAPVANVELDYQHSWESGSSSSRTRGRDSGHQSEQSEMDTMSVKDWSSYGYADAANVNPTWIWGQSYPWDVIQYNHSHDNSDIDLPSFVRARLVGTGSDGQPLLLPPSQLALFGVDFTMRASWKIHVPADLKVSETVSVKHVTTCFTATHRLNGAKVQASLQAPSAAASSTFTSPDLDLSTYALAPLVLGGAKNAASIGFAANPFTYPPTAAGGEFKIVAPANNLQVTGKGFTGTLVSDFTQPTTLSVTFKIVDTTSELSLLMMHWIGAQSGPVQLAVTINEKWSTVVHVDAREGAGGQNNITAIDLRNTDFSSLNYHDYLVIGLNRVEITATPVTPGAKQEYTLFALAIGAN